MDIYTGILVAIGSSELMAFDESLVVGIRYGEGIYSFDYTQDFGQEGHSYSVQIMLNGAHIADSWGGKN